MLVVDAVAVVLAVVVVAELVLAVVAPELVAEVAADSVALVVVHRWAAAVSRDPVGPVASIGVSPGPPVAGAAAAEGWGPRG
ncbi:MULTISPECIES: hypothetical protein [unclassified Cyanobium]|uniref:hypothetical protein n=1 Tax=unclassified Cyanobium TaxID=2627006 RepID=UPI0020CC61C8|nr:MULTISPECIES: hypothetical protein [unclassified Cyanobium]MCP9834650.1 hypothetical protein [Cyanobium sp. La Preciosa 7G6]MCP9937489.1 hypothetical protein [Cyanobium sp. Aljojuca 7A6]